MILATTKIEVLRPSSGADTDPYVVSDDSVDSVVVTGIPAHISAPSGRERVAGTGQEAVEFRLHCDVADIENNDRIYDLNTEETYEVIWAENRRGLGLNHTVAGISKVTGQA